MTVDQLIKKLQKLEPDRKVFISGQVFDSDEGYVEVESEIDKIISNDWRKAIEIVFERVL